MGNSDESDHEILKIDEPVSVCDRFVLQQNDKSSKKTKILVEKEIKKRIKINAKAVQPKEALKNIRIFIDSRFRNFDKKLKIVEAIKENSDSLMVIADEDLAVENSVCWKRQDPNDADALILEPDLCIILSAEELLEFTAKSGEDWLFLHVAKTRSQIAVDSNLRYIIFGLDHISRQNEKKSSKIFNLKQIIFETSMQNGVTFHQEPDLPAVGRHLAECTKSVAEKYYKQRIKGLKDFLAFAPDLKSVKLNENQCEENVQLCWRRMLQTAIGGRPNADRAAKAISNIYRCPRQLLNAYAKLNSPVERELMLELLIADDLTKVRVGPSISTVVCRSFTLADPEVTVDKPKK